VPIAERATHNKIEICPWFVDRKSQKFWHTATPLVLIASF